MKTNNNIPAYRFQGYTDAWELRKIFEIADRFNNLRVPIASSLRIPGSTPYYGANGIQDYVEGYTHNGEFVLIAEDGANDLKNYPVNLVNGKIWVNNHAHVLQGKENITNNKFLAYSINRANIEALLVGGGRAKLNSDVLMNIKLEIPSLKEQSAIGTFFSTLDRHITLHQRKLDTLKEQKKTYLKLLIPAKGQTKSALRFQGFEDDWEEVKLGEIYKFSQGLQVPVEEQFFEPREELVRFIRIVDLTCQNDDIRWVKKNKVGCVSREDIFFVRYGSVGEIGYGFEGIIANNLFKLNPL
ncbi:TPA: restriction endonuclease subunit S, partial [Streptococcus suis]|nr:restriction endonuclease subunit S [Streptococcus suis]